MEEKLKNMRHSGAHLLAAAVQKLYPKVKLAIGPAIDYGFYYDFDFGDEKVSEKDFPKIEKEMKKLKAQRVSFEKMEMSIEEAKEFLKKSDQPYSLSLLEDIEEFGSTVKEEQSKEKKKKTDEIVTFYKSGEFVNLCRGGHVKDFGEVGEFKITHVAGAYFRGSEKNPMLTRIYVACFPTKEELDAYLERQEEIKKSDHKKIARELDLIVFSDLVGAGLPLYTPKGAALRNAVYGFSRELNTKIGYGETALPSINRGELFKVSGHYDKYKDDMFLVHSHFSEEEFFLKPMNCPQHCEIFKSRTRSYRDLPIRLSDFSVLYRDEKPGEINGILRSRAFTQDDGHCFCREDQIGEEFERVLGVVDEALKTYGFEYWIRLSLRDPEHKEKYLGNDEIWNRAESTLRELVERKKLPFKEGLGEAAIYGPKLDFMALDSLGREWQISTIQLDMNMPGRFGLEYTDSDGSRKTPVMIHRAIIGSERFIGILIEHYMGKFPLWMAPIQIKIIPINEKHIDYAYEVERKLKEYNLRVEVDHGLGNLQKKIKEAQIEKINYMVILGDKEIESKSLSIRKRSGENMNAVSIDEFVNNLLEEIKTKAK